MNELMDRLLQATHNNYTNDDVFELYGQQTTDKKYKLMIKIHWETGVHYLCITKRKDFRKYKGSGIAWRKLLKSRPSIIITKLIFATNDVDELAEAGKFVSDFYSIVDNPIFANLIRETGYTLDPEIKKLIQQKPSKETLRNNGKIAGEASRDQKKGIHDPKYADQRSAWAKAGAEGLIKSGNRSGIFSNKWKDENEDLAKEISSKAGKVGGKLVGSMLWWNNGTINKKSNECPGKGWIRGMLVSEKKAAQLKRWTNTKPSQNTTWMNDGIKSKQVKHELVEEFLSNGWIIGRNINKKETK